MTDKAKSAELILKLYDLRREPVMREARNWFFATHRMAYNVPPEAQRHFFVLNPADDLVRGLSIAAVLGFTTIAGAAAGIAKILFFIFLVLTLVALVAGALRGRPPV